MWLARGLSNTEIAAQMGLQPSTVRSHLRKISRENGVSTRAGIVGYACRRNLLTSIECGGRSRKPLTGRQEQVLEAISIGLTNKEIGRKIYLAPDTVKCHTRRLCKALGVTTRAQAVAVAYNLGLLQVDRAEESSPEN